MEKERDQLARRLDQLDSEIDSLRGLGSRGSAASSRRDGRSRTRPKNARSLVEMLQVALRKPLSVTDAAAAVKKAGYKTNAKDFRAVVNLALIQNPKLFKRVERGVYKAA